MHGSSTAKKYGFCSTNALAFCSTFVIFIWVPIKIVAFAFLMFHALFFLIEEHVNTDLPMGPVHRARDSLPLITSKHRTKICHTSGSRALFTARDPQTSFFSNFFIKNRSHSTIHIFKNYFATVFLVFNFQQNKRYPNGPLVAKFSILPICLYQY